MSKQFNLCLDLRTNLRKLFRQFLKYLFVGGLSNFFAYVVYIGVVLLGFSPLTSMTLVYIVACCFSFAANQSWTFRSKVRNKSAFLKYIFAQVIGYLTNLALLSWLYYGLGLPHQIAQLVGIGVVAIELFLLSRYFIFH